MKSIKVLTEAGYDKGFGHFQRMLSIQECAARNNVPFEMIIDGDKAAKDNLNRPFVTFSDWQNASSDTMSLIRKNEVVVVDSYHVSLRKLEDIADRCDSMVVIDDNIRLDYHDMEVLNPNYYGEFLDYPKGKGNTYYLGRDYTLIKDAFDSPRNRRAAQHVENVLITMGGTDANNETIECIRWIKKINSEVRLHVVVTSAYRSIAEINSELAGSDAIYTDLSPVQMSERMKTADFAISSAGGTSNELIKMQCPAVLNVVADNQIRNAEIMSAKGCFRLLRNKQDDEIRVMFNRIIRQSMMEKMQTFFSNINGADFIVRKAKE